MSAAIAGFIMVLVVVIAADFRVLNALICFTKSILRRVLNTAAKGSRNE